MAAGDKITEGVRIIAALASVAQDPTLLSALKAGPGLLDSIKKLAASPPASFPRLVEDLAQSSARTFAELPEKPRDADVLYLQMVEASLPDPARIMAKGMDATAITEGMLACLVEPEHCASEMQALFRRITTPVLRELLADNTFSDGLRAAFMQEVMRFLSYILQKLDEKDGQAREILEGIALRFGERTPEKMIIKNLKSFLLNKVKDYDDMVLEIETLRGIFPQISRELEQAEAALQSLDFAVAETLLLECRIKSKNVIRKPIEANARVMEVQAKVALLRGDVDGAAELLQCAADSFAGLSSNEQSQRRLLYGVPLFIYGQKYGGEGLVAARKMWGQIIQNTNKSKYPFMWVTAQVSLASSLKVLGERIGGDVGSALLFEAIDGFRAALPVWVRLAVIDKEHSRSHWLSWANTQLNIGAAYQTCGQMLGGYHQEKMYNFALLHFGNSSKFFNKKSDKIQWAILQNYIGATLTALGIYFIKNKIEFSFESIIKIFIESIDIIENKSKLIKELEVDLSSLYNNMGIALWMEGSRLTGELGMIRLGEAIKAFEAALRIRTEKDYPIDRALTMENMGSAKECLAENEFCAERRAILIEADAHFNAALGSFDPNHMRHNYDSTTAALARVRAKLAALPDPA